MVTVRWQVSHRALRRRIQQTRRRELHVEAQCASHRVEAIVHIASLGDEADGVGGHTKADWGLSPQIPMDRIWYVSRLSPYDPTRPPGGSTAVIERLCRLADHKRAWCLLTVQPDQHDRTDAIIGFLSRRGWESHADARIAMVRQPSPQEQRA